MLNCNRAMVRLSCSKGFLFIAALLIYLDGQGVVFSWMLACLIHEMGHLISIKAFGGRVESIRLTAIGAEMILNSGISFSYGKEIMVSLAGPIANLIFALAFLRYEGYLFAGTCLCLGILNLVPICPLDGGRILTCVMMLVCPGYAGAVTKGISAVFAGSMLGLGVAAWRGWGNITLLYTAFWLMIGVVKS